MKRPIPVCLILALVLIPGTARAQNAATPENRAKAWSQILFDEGLLRSCEDPLLESSIALPQPKLTLDATEEGDTKIKARVGLKIKDRFVGSLEVTSPRSSTGEATLATLDGLSQGSAAELKLSWFHHQVEHLSEMVVGAVPEDWKNWSPEQKAAHRAETKNAPDVPEDWDLWSQEKQDAYKALQKVVATEATDRSRDGRTGGRTEWHVEDYLNPVLSRPSAVAAAGPKNFKEALAGYRDWLRVSSPLIPVLTVTAKADQHDFDFLTPFAGPPAGLKEDSESHTNYALTGSAGAYLWASVYSSLNYRLGNGYVSGRKKDFCTTSGLANILRCESHVVAPPRKSRTEVLDFEARGNVGNFGLGAFVSRDLRANVTQVKVPIYFLQKLGTTQSELNLGAVASWRSDTKDYSLSVFVGPGLSTVLRILGVEKPN